MQSPAIAYRNKLPLHVRARSGLAMPSRSISGIYSSPFHLVSLILPKWLWEQMIVSIWSTILIRLSLQGEYRPHGSVKVLEGSLLASAWLFV